MKRFYSLLLILTLIFSAVSCAKNATAKKMSEISGLDITAQMGTGWNLGNTLDATGNSTNSETSWGQPRTTKEMIDGLAKSGIKTIRIPTTWHLHIIDKNYTIDPNWLARVKEIVDWAIADDMYVILNIHHDNFEKKSKMPYGKGFYPTEENFEESSKFLQRTWEQIAKTFNKDYDEHLIFETLNEPRLIGTNHEWWYEKTAKECQEAMSCLNRFNQLIVETIRKSGENNKYRLILIPSLQASPESTFSTDFIIPKDPVESNISKIGLSIHMYSPYNFAMASPGELAFTVQMKQSLLPTFKYIGNQFVKSGYPAVITEYGATNKNNLEERVGWFKFFVGNTHKLGIPCCLWDNGQWEVKGNDYNEKYGYYNRLKQTWYFPEILDIIIESSK